MKCDKCGFIPNPGDQVCINCGAKLTLNNYTPEIILDEKKERRDNKITLILSIISVIVGIGVVFLIIKTIFFS